MKTATLMKCAYLPLCAIAIMFLTSSCDDDEDRPEIQYPETGFYGNNILMKGKTEYDNVENSLQAKLPEGKKLKIVITGLSVTSQTGFWYWLVGTSNNWAITKFD